MIQPGLGVMIAMLGGRSEEEVALFKAALNKTIAKTFVDKEKNELQFHFTDGTAIALYDNGQSCCENRWMHTDDDTNYFEGAKLLDIAIRDGGEVPKEKYKEGEYHDVWEQQFMEVKTDKGSFTVVNYVDHNGYYGGFYIRVREVS